MIILKNTLKYSLLTILINSTQARIYDIANFSNILQYDDQSKRLSILYTFQNNNIDGIHPSSLVQNDLGEVVGVTLLGGSNTCINHDTGENEGCGTIFRISNGQYSILHQFQGSTNSDGQYPFSLVKGAFNNADMIYGISPYGGVNNCGTIFSVDLFGDYTKLYDFTCQNGLPWGGLSNSYDGDLYGTTTSGQSIYRFDPSTNQVTTVYNLAPELHSTPVNNLEEINGTLYGISSTGSNNNTGFIYRVSTTGNNFKVLYTFGQQNTQAAANPSMITSDAVDNIYGVTTAGGQYNFGVIFQYTISTNSFKILSNFYGSIPAVNVLKYDFQSASLLGSLNNKNVNVFLSSATNFNLNYILNTSDTTYGIGTTSVIGLN